MTDKQQEYFKISLMWYEIAEQRKEQARQSSNLSFKMELLEKANQAAMKGRQFELKAKGE